MACKYKYKNNWYSEEQVKKLIESEIKKDDIVLELLKNYSHTIEINTAKIKGLDYSDPENYYTIYGSSLEEREEDKKIEYNTNYYSNLTVPGGTNYTENEISTPLITPSIKGRAAFSTDSGIGWFRGDEKQNYTEQDIDSLIDNMKKSGVLEINCS